MFALTKSHHHTVPFNTYWFFNPISGKCRLQASLSSHFRYNLRQTVLKKYCHLKLKSKWLLCCLVFQYSLISTSHPSAQVNLLALLTVPPTDIYVVHLRTFCRMYNSHQWGLFCTVLSIITISYTLSNQVCQRVTHYAWIVFYFVLDKSIY